MFPTDNLSNCKMKLSHELVNSKLYKKFTTTILNTKLIKFYSFHYFEYIKLSNTKKIIAY